jgi:hypothetical protein
MSIGLKSDSSGTSGSIVINGSDAVLVTPTGITTASIQNSSITTAKIVDANITFGKLSNSATEADNVAKRTAKAWVNFDGTTNTGGNCTIQSDFNVSTVADNGTGDYTINFTSALEDANYAVSFGINSQGTNNTALQCCVKATSLAGSPSLKTTTQLTIVVGNGGSLGNLDPQNVSVIILR